MSDLSDLRSAAVEAARRRADLRQSTREAGQALRPSSLLNTLYARAGDKAAGVVGAGRDALTEGAQSVKDVARARPLLTAGAVVALGGLVGLIGYRRHAARQEPDWDADDWDDEDVYWTTEDGQ